MPLLKNGRVMDDHWVELADNETVPSGAPVIVSLNRWLALREVLLDHIPGVGVLVENHTDLSALAGDLDHLKLIALEFPKFADGRAYSQARLLRRMGFKGEIRANGDILRDQIRAMHRCGIDAMAINDALAAEKIARDWQAIVNEISHAYQPAERGPEPVFRLRHRRAAA